MPSFDKNNMVENSFSKDPNTGKKRAFIVVFSLAVLAFSSTLYGIYLNFFKSVNIQTTYYLSQSAPKLPTESLFAPQPPEKKHSPENTDLNSSELIKQLEQEKENIEKTSVMLQKMIEAKENASKDEQNIADLSNIPSDNQLVQEKDTTNQTSQPQKNVPNKLDAALAAFNALDFPELKEKKIPDTQKKIPTSQKAIQKKNEKNSNVNTEINISENPYQINQETLQPDLIQSNLTDSLPDFSVIKKSSSSKKKPLEIIEPLNELQSKTENKKLPVKTKTNSPFSAYAKPFRLKENTPYIAVLFSGLGKKRNITQAAINTLPDVVSLSFSPYANNLGKYVIEARQSGHETLLDMPMQQGRFPHTDPGPLGLVTELPVSENRKRLHKVIGQDIAFIGLSATAEENFSLSEEQITPVLEELSDRGLIYVNGTDNPAHVRFSTIIRPDVHIFENFHRAAIRSKLDKAKQIALKNGAAFVRMEALPITLLVLEEWMKSVSNKSETEITFVPLSYYVKQKEAGK